MLRRLSIILLALAAFGSSAQAQPWVEQYYNEYFGYDRPDRGERWRERVDREDRYDRRNRGDKERRERTAREERLEPGDRWVLLGSRSVDLRKDKDRIDLTAAKGRVKAVRLFAKDRIIDISRVVVTYANGKAFTDKERIKIDAGEWSHPIDSRREERFVDSVDIEYRVHLGAAGPAQLEVWGLQSQIGAAVTRSGASSGTLSSGTSPTTAPSKKIETSSSQRAEDPTAGSDEILFGVQEVSFDLDRDVIKLGKEYGKFGRIRLRVIGNAIKINELRVVYSSGDPDVLAVDATIPADGRTPWLELKGNRFIKEIQLVYSGKPGSKTQARVEVYGEYAAGWYKAGSAEGAFAAANGGWLYLGGQSPLFVSIRKGLGYETDVVAVARNRGFKELRVDVKDRAITLNQLTIVYVDGSNDVLPVHQRVDGGSSYGPVELKPMPVKEIQVSYRSRIFDSGAKGSGYAFVEFWAK